MDNVTGHRGGLATTAMSAVRCGGERDSGDGDRWRADENSSARGGIGGAGRIWQVAATAATLWEMIGNGRELGETAQVGNSPQKRGIADNGKSNVCWGCRGHRTANSSCRCNRWPWAGLSCADTKRIWNCSA